MSIREEAMSQVGDNPLATACLDLLQQNDILKLAIVKAVDRLCEVDDIDVTGEIKYVTVRLSKLLDSMP